MSTAVTSSDRTSSDPSSSDPSFSDSSSLKQRMFRTRPEDVLPLKIEHQRIYILPTRRGLAFLFSLLVMLIASVNYALSLGYALCFLLTGLFAASLLHTYRNVAGIRFNQIKTENAFAGENVSFLVNMHNQTELDRIGVTIKATDASDLVDLNAHGTATANIVKATTRRGVRSLGRVTVTSTYPLGLWRTWCYIHNGVQATVYPKPEASPPPLPAHSIDADGESAHKSNQGEIAGLGEYNPGDALSSIAWKAAARGQGLYVKTFEEENSGGQTHLSLHATGLTDIEQQVSRLSAWIQAAERSQTEFSFDIPGTHLDVGIGPKHKERALVALATYGLPS